MQIDEAKAQALTEKFDPDIVCVSLLHRGFRFAEGVNASRRAFGFCIELDFLGLWF